MSAPSYESNLQVEPVAEPLDASEKLYTFEDITSAPSYFTLTESLVQLQCDGLEGDKDGYNPSGIHSLKVHVDDELPTPVTIVRTEKDTGAYSAESRFYRYDPTGELTELAIERRPWEDAAVCVLEDGTIVTSGVRVVWNKDDPSKHDRFFTEYYAGSSLDSQTYIGQSPNGHKDSRLAVIDDKIVLWTRPQLRSFEGKIHYTTLENIEELSGAPNEQGERVAQTVYDRCEPVGAGIFAEGTWGGPNGAVDVGNGWALVQCHVSHQTWENVALHAVSENEVKPAEVLEYNGFMILHHPDTGVAKIFGPHMSESDFPPGGAKWPKVRRVVFPGGLHDVVVLGDGNISGGSTVGLRDKDMFYVGWETTTSLGNLILSSSLTDSRQ